MGESDTHTLPDFKAAKTGEGGDCGNETAEGLI
jgi:hypothetical protein